MSQGSREEVDALAAECDRLTAFLHGISDDDWSRPTRCAPWDVRMVLIHMTAMMERVAETCAEPFAEEEPRKDRLRWWDYDIEEDQAETAEWIEAESKRYPEGSVLGEWEAAVGRAVPAASAILDDVDPVVMPGEQPIRLSEYIATRVLEMTIHATDVLDAFGRAPDPSPAGLAVTMTILSGRLGADPRTFGLDDADFALASTGRREVTDAERERLGPLAEKLPLLA